MTTLVTTIANTICVVTSAEDMSEAYDVHQAKVDAAIIGEFGEAEEACEWGIHYVRKDFTTYVNGKYSYEGYFTVQDRNFWGYGDYDYQWAIRLKGIDYDVEDDLEDKEVWE